MKSVASVVSGWSYFGGNGGRPRMGADKGVTMIKRIKADKSEQRKMRGLSTAR